MHRTLFRSATLLAFLSACEGTATAPEPAPMMAGTGGLGGTAGTSGAGGAGGTGGTGGIAGGPAMLDSGLFPMDASHDAAPEGDGAADAANDASTVADAGYVEDPGDDGDGDLEIGEPYTRDPALTDLGNPEGREFNFKMALADSDIFKGDDATLDPGKPVRTERNIWATSRPPIKTATRRQCW
jgi:hypothetical protein